MVRLRISGVQRGAALLAGALLLPTLVLLGALLVSVLGREQRRVEEQALSNAQRILAGAEARLSADQAALKVLSAAYGPSDDTAARRLTAEAMKQLPGWRDIRIARTSDTPRRPASVRDGLGCPCVLLAEPIQARPGFSLIATVSPDVYQGGIVGVVRPPAIAALVDENGRFVARTVHFEERVGTPATRYVRDAIRGGLASGLYRGVTWEGLANYTAFARSPRSDWSAHVAVQRRSIDGPRTWLLVAAILLSLLTLLTAAGLVAFSARDMELRRRESQSLLALQRTEAVGNFTSGIAHDFRNLLMVVIGNLERLVASSPEPDVARRASLALDAARRGARLSNQLLSFARTNGAELAPVEPTELLADVGDLLRQSGGPGLALDWSVAPDTPAIIANRDQLELALLNLVVNARDAMNGDGSVSLNFARVGERVELRAADTGPGVPAEIKPRLFEPFFTTKAAGKGTGLGLAQVAGAVHQAGGAVRVENGPGGGAVFVLSFRPA